MMVMPRLSQLRLMPVSFWTPQAIRREQIVILAKGCCPCLLRVSLYRVLDLMQHLRSKAAMHEQRDQGCIYQNW